MKKIISFVITVLLVASVFSLAAFAADETAVEDATTDTSATTAATVATSATTAPDSELTTVTTKDGIKGYAVYLDWEENGYPDDIGAVLVKTRGSSTSPEETGESTVPLSIRYFIYAVKGMTDERKAELTELLDCRSISFRECSISKNERDAYIAELRDSIGVLLYDIETTFEPDDIKITLYYPKENDEKIRRILKDEFPYIEDYCVLKSGVDPRKYETTQSTTAATITNVGMEGYAVYKDWEENGYPDDIGLVIASFDGYNPSSGVTTLYNKFIIYVVEGASEERKAELKEMMGTPYVYFRECTMSKNTQNYFVKSLRERIGDLAYKIVPTADKYDLVIALYYPEENDEAIRKIVWDEFPEAAEYCEFKSGVNPNDVGMQMPENDFAYYWALDATGELGTDGSRSGGGPDAILFIAIAATLALTAGLFFALRRKSVKNGAEALVLTNGETVEASKPLTKREAEEKVSQSVVEPSDKVFDEIMKNADK